MSIWCKFPFRLNGCVEKVVPRFYLDTSKLNRVLDWLSYWFHDIYYSSWRDTLGRYQVFHDFVPGSLKDEEARLFLQCWRFYRHRQLRRAKRRPGNYTSIEPDGFLCNTVYIFFLFGIVFKLLLLYSLSPHSHRVKQIPS